jgi:hypothetical protein
MTSTRQAHSLAARTAGGTLTGRASGARVGALAEAWVGAAEGGEPGSGSVALGGSEGVLDMPTGYAAVPAARVAPGC